MELRKKAIMFIVPLMLYCMIFSVLHSSHAAVEYTSDTAYMPVTMYNGDPDLLHIEIEEPTIHQTSYVFGYWGVKPPITINAVLDPSQRFRLAEYYDAKTNVNNIITKKYIPFSTYKNRVGFVSGDINMKVWYDFNENGRYDNGEYIGTQTYSVSKQSERQQALDIAQAAVEEYGTSNYNDDMAAIESYIYNNYSKSKVYGNIRMDCSGGASVLETWSIWKYGVYGYTSNPDIYNPNHIAFYPENNPYSSILYWEAQGHSPN